MMKFDREMVKGYLPVMVMAVLERESLHGYALCARLKEASSGALRPGEGTIYPLLYRLERQGMIKGRWTTSPSGRERKVYSLTKKGRKRLAQQKGELREMFTLLGNIFTEGWIKA